MYLSTNKWKVQVLLDCQTGCISTLGSFFFFSPISNKVLQNSNDQKKLKVYIWFRGPTIDLNADAKEDNSTGSHVNQLPDLDGF